MRDFSSRSHILCRHLPTEPVIVATPNGGCHGLLQVASLQIPSSAVSLSKALFVYLDGEMRGLEFLRGL